MRVVKLMPDYECHPLWDASPGEVGNIDPATLPLSADLRGRLILWADRFDATLNQTCPPLSGFPDAEAEWRFWVDGEDLARQLRAELGPAFRVVRWTPGGEVADA